MRIDSAAMATLAVMALCCGDGRSQPYPARPVRIIVPFPAGGGTDVIARLIARKLGEDLGQSFVVDNRAGAAGIIACELAARAVPDDF